MPAFSMPARHDSHRRRARSAVVATLAVAITLVAAPTAALAAPIVLDVEFNPGSGYVNPTLRTGLDPTSLQPIENTIEFSSAATGFVSAWVDWNQDGVYSSAERVASSVPVATGGNTFSFTQGTQTSGIQTTVRIRFGADAASVSSPDTVDPSVETENFSVLVDRLVQSSTCTTTTTTYDAFTFGQPVLEAGNGGVGTRARYSNVSVAGGVAVDMIAEVTAGLMNISTAGMVGGFGHGSGGIFDIDDARWQIRGDATIKYSFVEAGTTTPVPVNSVFTVNDMDGFAGQFEIATFNLADLAGYAVSSTSAVTVNETATQVSFHGVGTQDGGIASRFQVTMEGITTFQVRWQGGLNSGFGFDGDGDLAINPACYDFGDAPDTYRTSLTADGPRHAVIPGLTLGTLVDFETDGEPSSDARGDDETGRADEDGVSGEITVVAGDETTVSVRATNTTGAAAILAGWIDLDGNGVFDAAELVSVAVPANSGTATYMLTFPAGITETDTFARFRLLPGGTSTIVPTGSATAGEVEDYPVAVVVRDLAVTKSSTFTADSRAGDSVVYSVTATNTGTSAYTDAAPAVIFDDLQAVLDDASYNNDAAAASSDGSATPDPAYLAPHHVSWAGPIAAGESVTITYSVTLRHTGDGELRNIAWQPTVPPEPGVIPPTPSCAPPTSEGADPETGEACATTEGLLPRLTITKTSNTDALPVTGGTVTYTVVVANAGPGSYTAAAPAVVTDDLSEVLDDATFGTILAPTSGASFDEATHRLRWEGELAAGASTEIRYTVSYTGAGDNILYNVACVPGTQTAPGAAACAQVQIPAAELTQWKSVDPAFGTTVRPGQVLTYTLHFQNSGQAPAIVDAEDVLTNVLDDATVTSAPSSSDPALDVTEIVDGRFGIAGTLDAGRTVTVSYEVTVKEGERGDDRLANFLVAPDTVPPAQCVPADPDRPDCTVNHVSDVTVTKSADPASGSSVVVGQDVRYTLTFRNLSTNPDSAAVGVDYTDHLVNVLDDAVLVAGPMSSDSDVTSILSGKTIRVSGAISAGETITVTYTVTVKPWTSQGDHTLTNVIALTGEEPVCATDSTLCTEHDVTPPRVPVTGGGLALTGGAVAWSVVGTAALLIVAGGVLLYLRRRNDSSHEA